MRRVAKTLPVQGAALLLRQGRPDASAASPAWNDRPPALPGDGRSAAISGPHCRASSGPAVSNASIVTSPALASVPSGSEKSLSQRPRSRTGYWRTHARSRDGRLPSTPEATVARRVVLRVLGGAAVRPVLASAQQQWWERRVARFRPAVAKVVAHRWRRPVGGLLRRAEDAGDGLGPVG